eukprot:s92_g49.t1
MWTLKHNVHPNHTQSTDLALQTDSHSLCSPHALLEQSYPRPTCFQV